MTNAIKQSPPRDEKRALPQRALAELLAETLQRGFYGSACVSLTIQDGHVQHVRVSTERQVR